MEMDEVAECGVVEGAAADDGVSASRDGEE